MRIRTIKPEWLEDERMALASDAARVASVALILLADDYGRGRANLLMLGSRIFPGSPGKVRETLAELSRMDFLVIYEIRGQNYYEITNWQKHQRVDKPGRQRIQPSTDSSAKILGSLANVPETLANDLGPRTLVTGTPITTIGGFGGRKSGKKPKKRGKPAARDDGKLKISDSEVAKAESRFLENFNCDFERAHKPGTFSKEVRAALEAGYSSGQLSAAVWYANLAWGDDAVRANVKPVTLLRLKHRDKPESCLPGHLRAAEELWQRLSPTKTPFWREQGELFENVS